MACCVVPPRQEGRTRRHERGAGCDGRGSVDTTGDVAADGEVVWSWRPDAGAKSVDRTADDGGKRARSPGRARISRKTIAQGRPDDPPVPVVLPRAFFVARGPWVRWAPGLPCALCFFEGLVLQTTRARKRAETVDVRPGGFPECCIKFLLVIVFCAEITSPGAAPRMPPYAHRACSGRRPAVS